MNILIASSYLPHPRSGHGTGVFLYGFVSRLSKRHRVTLVSFCDRHELPFVSDLSSLPVRLELVRRGRGAVSLPYLLVMRILHILRGILFWQPAYVARFWHPAMGSVLKRLTRNETFDVVQFEMSEMAQYRTYVKAGRTILHEHDVELRPAYRAHRAAGKPGSYLNWCRWFSYERRAVRCVDHVFTVTEQDAGIVRGIYGQPDVTCLPRGTDVPAAVARTPEPGTLLFVGTFGHEPNVDAAMRLVEEIFPMVTREMPGARLTIAGNHAPDALRSAASKHPGITVAGFVEDIGDLYNRSALFVAPLRLGGGIKIKILHAMAYGMPVVTTKIGREGIDGVTDEHLATGTSPEEIARKIVSLLRDPAKAARMGMAGQKLMRKNYSWEAVVELAERTYGRP